MSVDLHSILAEYSAAAPSQPVSLARSYQPEHNQDLLRLMSQYAASAASEPPAPAIKRRKVDLTASAGVAMHLPYAALHLQQQLLCSTAAATALQASLLCRQYGAVQHSVSPNDVWAFPCESPSSNSTGSTLQLPLHLRAVDGNTPESRLPPMDLLAPPALTGDLKRPRAMLYTHYPGVQQQQAGGASHRQPLRRAVISKAAFCAVSARQQQQQLPQRLDAAQLLMAVLRSTLTADAAAAAASAATPCTLPRHPAQAMALASSLPGTAAVLAAPPPQQAAYAAAEEYCTPPVAAAAFQPLAASATTCSRQQPSQLVRRAPAVPLGCSQQVALLLPQWAEHKLLVWAKGLGLQNVRTIQLALHMWKRLLTKYTVQPTGLVAIPGLTLVESALLGCLVVSAKLEECRKGAPTSAKVAAFVASTSACINALELQLLQLLDWRPLEGWQQLRPKAQAPAW